jgi:hypothetical protein
MVHMAVLSSVVAPYCVLEQQGLLVHAEAGWTLRVDGITSAIGLLERLQQLMTRQIEALPEPMQRLCHLAERGARRRVRCPGADE